MDLNRGRGFIGGGNLIFACATAKGGRKCLTCKRARAREWSAAIRAACIYLGMTQRAYVAAYGWSLYTARAVAAGLTDPLMARAEGERLKAIN